MEDSLVSIFLLVDWATLLKSSLVCKRWRCVILSPEFRADWRKKHGSPTLLLVSAYNHDWHEHPRPKHLLVWSPTQPTSPLLPPPMWMKIPLPAATFDIVASSHGLVAARHPSWSDDITPGAEFTVGNPVTNEWVRIPRLTSQKLPGRLFSLTVDPSSGEFGLLDWYNQHMYESSSRSWVGMTARIGSGSKVMDVAQRRQVKLRTPIYDSSGPDCNMGCASFVWEHLGNKYIGQTTRCFRSNRKTRYKVWSMESTLDAPRCREVASSRVDVSGEVVHVDDSIVMECQADGNLVCFTGQCRNFFDSYVYESDSSDGEPCEPWLANLGPEDSIGIENVGDPLPVVVYDLDQHKWSRIPSSKGLHHRRAVVYRPSAVRPSGCGDGGLDVISQTNEAVQVAEFGDGNHWHKRKREDQPDMASVRKLRIAAVTAEVEMWEDIFYL